MSLNQEQSESGSLLSGERFALLDVLLELWQACLNELLLLSRDKPDGVNLLNTVYLHWRSNKRVREKRTGRLTPSSTFEAKKSTPLSAYKSLLTNVGVTTPFSPERPRRSAFANFAPAYAIERVALPAPSFAFTTSSPPNWIRCTSFSYFSPEICFP